MYTIIKVFAYIAMIVSAVLFVGMSWLDVPMRLAQADSLPFVLSGLALANLLTSGAVIVVINKVREKE